MGLFDAFRHKEPEQDRAADAAAGGPDGFFDVLDADGHLVRYLPDDFDEIWTTTDEHEAARHVRLGWLMLDEVVGPSSDPGHEELRQTAVYTGSAGGDGFLAGAGGLAGFPGSGVSKRTVPVHVDSDETATTYVLGYLRPGRTASPIEPGTPQP